MIPFVSVIIPTWNRKDLLVLAVQSVLAQENVSVEVLACDDGSDDGTRETIAAWDDARVRLIVGPRAGCPAVPRNRGIAAAKGEWLAFLDDDDVWLPKKLRMQLDKATQCDALAVCANALRRVPGREKDVPYFTGLPGWLQFSDLATVNSVITSSALIHRSLFQCTGGFPEEKKFRAIEDYALWLRVAALVPFACVNTPLLIYRDAPEQSIRNQSFSENKRQTHVFANWLLWAKSRAFSAQGAIALKRFMAFRFPRTYGMMRRVRNCFRAA